MSSAYSVTSPARRGAARNRPSQAGGAELQGLTPAAETFATREDAETWLSAHYQELREAGVGQVRLMEDGTERYGPLSLMG